MLSNLKKRFEEIEWDSGIATALIFCYILLVGMLFIYFNLQLSQLYTSKAIAQTRCDAVANAAAVWSYEGNNFRMQDRIEPGHITVSDVTDYGAISMAHMLTGDVDADGKPFVNTTGGIVTNNELIKTQAFRGTLNVTLRTGIHTTQEGQTFNSLIAEMDYKIKPMFYLPGLSNYLSLGAMTTIIRVPGPSVFNWSNDPNKPIADFYLSKANWYNSRSDIVSLIRGLNVETSGRYTNANTGSRKKTQELFINDFCQIASLGTFDTRHNVMSTAELDDYYNIAEVPDYDWVSTDTKEAAVAAAMLAYSTEITNVGLSGHNGRRDYRLFKDTAGTFDDYSEDRMGEAYKEATYKLMSGLDGCIMVVDVKNSSEVADGTYLVNPTQTGSELYINIVNINGLSKPLGPNEKNGGTKNELCHTISVYDVETMYMYGGWKSNNRYADDPYVFDAAVYSTYLRYFYPLHDYTQLNEFNANEYSKPIASVSVSN